MIHNTKLSIIVAMDGKRGIGKDNKIPWHISEDFKHFKKITSGSPIIMGRKTWESLPTKPLPNRTNIIVSQNSKLKTQNYNSNLKTGEILIANSIEQAIEFAKMTKGIEEIFIIGGGQIFQQTLPLADKLYLTIVEGDYVCDTFFPDYSIFKKVISEESKESEGHKYKFLELER